MNYYSVHYQLMSFAATEKRQIAQLNAETPRKCLRFELGKTDERDFILKNLINPAALQGHDTCSWTGGSNSAGGEVNWRSGHD